MQITVFGASGRVGRCVVEIAQARGHSVVAMVHAHNPFIESDTLRVVEGDINKPADVDQALQGSQAVISTLGSWGTINKNILSSGMGIIIPAMQQHGIKRIVSLTGADALLPDEKPKFLQQFSRRFLKLISPKILADGEKHLQQLAASNLDWTCVRSPAMTNFGSTNYRLRLKWPFPFRTINRKAVATAMVGQLEATDFLKQAPTIFRR